MIVCPNCNHHNPEGATQCEACYTPLPEMMSCPNCGAQVQVDANFCGQCGFSIQVQEALLPTALEAGPSHGFAQEPDSPQPAAATFGAESPAAPSPAAELSAPDALEPTAVGSPEVGVIHPPIPSVASTAQSSNPPPQGNAATQLQGNRAALLHLRTNVEMNLPENLSVVHIGKPNDRIPPDIDVSGFPDSEVVSRVHADIRVEGDAYFIEDLGSSNGTYINNLPLAPGNRHRLRMGDRIALGKGDLVTFLFQMA